MFDDVVMRDNPNWLMVGFNVTAFIISTLFIGIIVCYLNAKVSSWFNDLSGYYYKLYIIFIRLNESYFSCFI